MVTHLGDVKSEEKVDSLAVTLAKVVVETGGDTLGDEEAKPVLDNLADILAVVEIETLHVTLSNLKAETPADTVAVSLAVMESRATWRHTGQSRGPGCHRKDGMRTLFVTHYAKCRTKHLSTSFITAF